MIDDARKLLEKFSKEISLDDRTTGGVKVIEELLRLDGVGDVRVQLVNVGRHEAWVVFSTCRGCYDAVVAFHPNIGFHGLEIGPEPHMEKRTLISMFDLAGQGYGADVTSKIVAWAVSSLEMQVKSVGLLGYG